MATAVKRQFEAMGEEALQHHAELFPGRVGWQFRDDVNSSVPIQSGPTIFGRMPRR
jgi:hypothetical protein